MTHSTALDLASLQLDPQILLVPGLNDSGPTHWQSLWGDERDDCHKVELGMWDNPHRNTWVNQLNLAILKSDRPAVLVAHSLGCLAVAWWAEYERPAQGNPVVGALLVAPPDAAQPGADPRIMRFGTGPRTPLPFPSVLVASRDDPYCSIDASRSLAHDWGSRFVAAGAAGHINASSEVGSWAFGKLLLDRLLAQHRARHRPQRTLALRPNRAHGPSNGGDKEQGRLQAR